MVSAGQSVHWLSAGRSPASQARTQRVGLNDFNLVLAAALLAASAYCLADNKIIINANAWTGNHDRLTMRSMMGAGQKNVLIKRV
jgi:hypothetical protein